jgi:hypothetical protein
MHPIFLNHPSSINHKFSWDGLIAISTLAAVLVALFGERFWKWINRPVINVDYDVNSERCYRWAIREFDLLQDQYEFMWVKRQYFRLRVTNTGKTTIHNLKAKIELYDEDNNLADRFEPTELSWITDVKTIDLAPNEDSYLNVISQAIEPKDGKAKYLDQQLNRVECGTIKYKLRLEINNRTQRGIAWDRYLLRWKFRISFHADDLPKPIVKFYIFTPLGDSPGKLEEDLD